MRGTVPFSNEMKPFCRWIVQSKWLLRWPNSPNSIRRTNGIRHNIGFKATNSEAKYEILLVGLRIASEFEVKSLDVFSNSQLVVCETLTYKNNI